MQTCVTYMRKHPVYILQPTRKAPIILTFNVHKYYLTPFTRLLGVNKKIKINILFPLLPFSCNRAYLILQLYCNTKIF